MVNTPLPDWDDPGSAPDEFCRVFEITFLTWGGDSRDFRFLFGGREGSDETGPRGVDVLARLSFKSLGDGPGI